MDEIQRTRRQAFWRKVLIGDGCWEWKGARHSGWGGYGLFSPVKGWEPVRAHRYAYECLVGPVPADHDLHHKCGNSLCVRPDHLEPISPAEHVLLGNGPPAQNARKTHCLRGHPFDEEHSVVWRDRDGDSHRLCQICGRERAHERYCRLKAERQAQAQG